MTWYAAIIVAALTVNALLVVAAIGKPRAPITPGVAVANLIVAAVLIWGVVSLAVRA